MDRIITRCLPVWSRDSAALGQTGLQKAGSRRATDCKADSQEQGMALNLSTQVELSVTVTGAGVTKVSFPAGRNTAKTIFTAVESGHQCRITHIVRNCLFQCSSHEYDHGERQPHRHYLPGFSGQSD